MTPAYEITMIKPNLMFINWLRSPSPVEEKDFNMTLMSLLDETKQPIYLLSDLRHGRLMSFEAVRTLSGITHHANFAGSSGYTQNPMSVLFAKQFLMHLTRNRDRNTLFDYPRDAIKALHDLEPGIMDGVYWEEHIHDVPVDAIRWNQTI